MLLFFRIALIMPDPPRRFPAPRLADPMPASYSSRMPISPTTKPKLSRHDGTTRLPDCLSRPIAELPSAVSGAEHVVVRTEFNGNELKADAQRRPFRACPTIFFRARNVSRSPRLKGGVPITKGKLK
jgi:hypothetical protein